MAGGWAELLVSWVCLSAVSGPIQFSDHRAGIHWSGLSCAPDLHSDYWQIIPFLVSVSPSEQGGPWSLPPETRSVVLDLRKTTCRMMI